MVKYPTAFLINCALVAFACKLGSRRQIDYELGQTNDQMLHNLNRLSHTDLDRMPVGRTVDHLLGHLVPCALPELRTKMIRQLIRTKALDDCRLQGRFVIAVDGTGWLTFDQRHCPHCLVQHHKNKDVYYHMVQEAKLVGPSGLALSVGTQFVENPYEHRPAEDLDSTSNEKQKQDCELKAFARLVPDLRRDFPQLPICLSSDNLYACGSAMQLAKDARCSFIYTFKPGGMPAVWAEFQALLTQCPENTFRLILPDGTRQVYRWVNDLSYEDDQRRTHGFNAIQLQETRDGNTTTFAWITDLRVGANSVVEIATKGGRIRSKIENEGFNIQKNSGLNLEHVYSHDLTKAKAYYFLIQIAHLVLQLLEHGSLLVRLAKRVGKSPWQLFGSLKNVARRLLDCFRYFVIPDQAFDAEVAARIRIGLTAT